MARRLTRAESQARTRERLLRAAVRTFTREGVERASIETIARNAGYSRGAFYSNFKDKEALCLALLEQGFDAYLERFARILAAGEEPEVRAQRAGDHLSRLVAADPAWQRLHLELQVYALRNPRFRRSLVEQHRALRRRVAEIFEAGARELGVEPPLPLEELTMITFAISLGFALETMLEPDEVPADLHGRTLAVLFAGLRKLVEGAD